MLKEAGDFANHLKHCEKCIRELKVATEGMQKSGPGAAQTQLMTLKRR